MLTYPIWISFPGRLDWGVGGGTGWLSWWGQYVPPINKTINEQEGMYFLWGGADDKLSDVGMYFPRWEERSLVKHFKRALFWAVESLFKVASTELLSRGGYTRTFLSTRTSWPGKRSSGGIPHAQLLNLLRYVGPGFERNF